MDSQDIKRLNELKGVLGNALREVEGLLAKYEEPQPLRHRNSHKKDRINDYRYRFLSGGMTRKR